MPISWGEVARNQHKSLESALALQELEQSGLLRTLSQAEEMRQAREIEKHRGETLEESKRHRMAQEEETRRRNREMDEERKRRDEDRDAARFYSTLDRLSPGDLVDDPTVLERATKQGLGGLFALDPETGKMKYTGTAAQRRAIEAATRAEERAAAAEERERRMAYQWQKEYEARERERLRQDADRDANRVLAEKRLQRQQAIDQSFTRLSPQQQVAYRTILADKIKKNSGGALYDTFGVGQAPRDVVDLAEEAYKEVTGSDVLGAKPSSGTTAPKAGSTQQPQQTSGQQPVEEWVRGPDGKLVRKVGGQ